LRSRISSATTERRGGAPTSVGFTDGSRESAQDWRDLLLDLKRRGLDVRPELAIADGALGFWKAAGEVWPTTASSVVGSTRRRTNSPSCQRASSQRRNARCRRFWMAETKADAEAAFGAFVESYRTKYDKAAECLTKDRDALLTFYDFPAEHW
jgi:putative transposase